MRKNQKQQNKYEKSVSSWYVHDYRQKYKQFQLWVIWQAGGMMPKTTWSFSALGTDIRRVWQADIKHLLSDVHLADAIKTVRPGCTAGVSIPTTT